VADLTGPARLVQRQQVAAGLDDFLQPLLAGRGAYREPALGQRVADGCRNPAAGRALEAGTRI
jgi:hypothetical protein